FCGRAGGRLGETACEIVQDRPLAARRPQPFPALCSQGLTRPHGGGEHVWHGSAWRLGAASQPSKPRGRVVHCSKGPTVAYGGGRWDRVGTVADRGEEPNR